MDTNKEEQNEVSDPAATIAADPVAIFADAQPDGKMAGSNKHNENGLICPPGMNLEVFNSLTIKMQREVVEQHRATEGVSDQINYISYFYPEALASITEDMQQEVIDQEYEQRRLWEEAPTEPSNVEETDNDSFVASIDPDLRKEIALNAGEGFLTSLHPDMQGEVQILR